MSDDETTPTPSIPTPPPTPWWAAQAPAPEPTAEPAPRTEAPPVRRAEGPTDDIGVTAPWGASALGAPTYAAPPPPPASAPPSRHHSNKLVALVAIAALAGGLAIGRASGSVFDGRTSTFRGDTPTNGGFDAGIGTTPLNNDANTNGNGNAGSSDASSATTDVAKAVVNINITTASGQAAGTGMIITSSGEVLTNNHVIKGAEKISVELSDGSDRSAQVLGYSVSEDVALIKIDGVSGLPTISASTASASVGSAVVAMGNALGKGGAPSIVKGTITAVDQTITASDQGGGDAETLDNLIQTDAPIQPGDSGGPLADTNGRVVGMDTAASTGNGFRNWGNSSGTSEAYAIPIQDALTIAKQIEKGQASDTVHIGARAILGVQLASSASGNGFGLGDGSSNNGAVVGDVQSDGPAARAGITGGDTITKIDDTNVSSADELAQAMSPYRPGDKVSVTWTDSSGSSRTATVQLVEGPPA